MNKRKILIPLFLVFSFIYSFAETPTQQLKQVLKDERWGIWYLTDVLRSKKRDTIYAYASEFKDRPRNWAEELDAWVYWYEEKRWQAIVTMSENNKFLIFPKNHYYIIRGIDKSSSLYNVDILLSNSRLEQNKSFDTNIGINWDLINDKTAFTFLFLFDGDYLDIFIDDFNTYFTTFCHFTEPAWAELENLIYTNTCDLTNVIFPRRADKNHNVGTTCIVAESLRLRKEESTSSATLHTMKAGTKVTILQLGKQQTIDGITANWVQVEVLDASLEEGLSKSASTSVPKGDVRRTTGWCFGGYLLEQ